MEKLQIYTDGSSLGNPGPGGYGIVIIDKQTDTVIAERGGYEKETTNNRMELKGAIEAVHYIHTMHPQSHTIIYTDSAYVLGGVTNWVHNWEKNGWRTSAKQEVLNQDLWKELISIVRAFKGELTWQKVKGHAGDVYNERADEIATSFSSLQEEYSL